jgi:HK97 family phage major capsid protein
MADPIEVPVPANASEAKELQAKLASHEIALNEHLDSNEANWTAECETQFKAMQADEASMVKALEAHCGNVEAAAQRRSTIGAHAEAFEARLQATAGGSTVARAKRVEEAKRQADDVTALSDKDLVNLAVGGFICQVTDRRPDADQVSAMGQYEAQLRGQLMDRKSKSWSSTTTTIDSADDDFVARLQMNEIQNVLGTTNPAYSGDTSPNELYGASFVEQMEEARLHFGGMNQVADIMTTDSGEPINWPTANDTGNQGVGIAEATAPAAADPSFGVVSWGAFKLSSKEIIVNRELIEDNQVRLVSRLAGMLGERLGREENRLFTVGAGTTEPTGIATASTSGLTGASNSAIIYDELIDLEHSVDPAYRGAANRYMFHDSTLLLIRKLKDSNGLYLWNSGAVSGIPSSLNGYGYTINQDMDEYAATKKVVIFGDLKKFKIRRVRGTRLVVTDELYSRTDQVGFFAWVRVDSNLLDAGTNPVKHLTTPA